MAVVLHHQAAACGLSVGRIDNSLQTRYWLALQQLVPVHACLPNWSLFMYDGDGGVTLRCFCSRDVHMVAMTAADCAL